MIIRFVVGLALTLSGILVGFLIHLNPAVEQATINLIPGQRHQMEVIGFLPFWLIDKASHDYSKSLTTLAYFSLGIDADGQILEFTKPTETEPGWNTLKNGRAQPLLDTAKKQHQKLSLVMFSGDHERINNLISDPEVHARNLVSDVAPIMKQYGFQDLNIDVESVEVASESARLNFSRFMREVKKQVEQQKLGSLTVEISPSDFIHPRLINPADMGEIADHVVMMTYDYHYIGSYVTGPVAPVGGGGDEAEFDTKIAIELAIKQIPATKIVLGIPLYGYEWETIDQHPRAPVIPGSGLTASNQRAEELIRQCTNCSVQMDVAAQEQYLTYLDPETKTYHQIFYPEAKATQAKIDLAKQYKLGGVALWALGYEGDQIMQPLNR